MSSRTNGTNGTTAGGEPRKASSDVSIEASDKVWTVHEQKQLEAGLR